MADEINMQSCLTELVSLEVMVTNKIKIEIFQEFKLQYQVGKTVMRKYVFKLECTSNEAQYVAFS